MNTIKKSSCHWTLVSVFHFFYICIVLECTDCFMGVACERRLGAIFTPTFLLRPSLVVLLNILLLSIWYSAHWAILVLHYLLLNLFCLSSRQRKAPGGQHHYLCCILGWLQYILGAEEGWAWWFSDRVGWHRWSLQGPELHSVRTGVQLGYHWSLS